MAFLPTLSHTKKPAAIMSPKRQMKHGSVLWLTVRKSIPAFISRPLRRRFRRQRAPHFMIDPETKHKMAWDVLLTCCVMYTTCVVPYRVCFKRDATGGFATFESVLDLFFGGDIVLNFLTGVQLPSGEVTYDTATVARTYLRGWFLVDFFSTIPFDDFSDWFGTTTDPRASKALSSAKLLRSLKVLRLFKLARIRKLTKLFLNLEDAVFTNQSLLSLTKLALTMLFLSHLVACLWFAIGNQAPSNGDSHTSMSWVYEYEFQDREPVLQYLVSVYWAIVTMVTIGYGDVLATNNLERLFNIAIMAIGVSFFGYVIGTITTLVSNLDVAAALYDERLTTVKEYIISRSIPAYMSKRIRDHFEYFYQNRSVFKEKTILNRLPTAMRNEMIHHIHAKVVARVHYFRHCHESLISAIVMSMRPFNVLKDEYVYGQHEIAAHVFFLLKGKVHLTKAVAVTMAKGGAPGGEWRLATLLVGEHFGELEVYDHEHGNGVRICSAIAKSYCELTFLSRQAITKISTSWPEVLDHFKDAAKDTSKRMRRRVENSTTDRKTGSADEDHDEGEGEDEDDESDAASRRLFHDEEMEQKMATSTLLAHKSMLSRPHPVSSRVAPYIRPEIKSKSNTEGVNAAAPKDALDLFMMNEGVSNVVNVTAADEVVTLTTVRSVGEILSPNHHFAEPVTSVASRTSSKGAAAFSLALTSSPSLPASHLSSMSDLAASTGSTAVAKSKPSMHGRIVLEALMAKKPPPAKVAEDAAKLTESSPSLEIFTTDSEQTSVLINASDHTAQVDNSVVPITPSASPVAIPAARKSRRSRSRGSGIGDLVDGFVEDDEQEEDEAQDLNSTEPLPAPHHPVVPPTHRDENAIALTAAARFLPRLQPKVAAAAVVATPQTPLHAWKQVATTAAAVRRSQLESRRNLSEILAKIRGSTAAKPKPNFHSERAMLNGTYLLHPQEPFVLSWQFVVGIGILYSIIVVPYRLGFNADADGAWLVLENIIDCFFGIDIILNFRTAFYDDERLLVFDSRVILRRYVRGWFVVDFLSTVPVDDIARALMGGTSIQFFPTKLLRLFRIARLLKLARLIKLSRVAGRLRDFIDLSPSTERLGKLLMVMSLFCHWNACAFHAAMLASEGAGVGSWCDEFFPVNAVHTGMSVSSSSSLSSGDVLCSDRVDRTDRYIASVYWAFTTFTTVGYGDIRPSMYSTYELSLVILLVVFNSTVYGYIISAVVTLIKNLDPSDREYRLLMTEMKDYLRDSTVGARLGANIKAHYQHSVNCNSLFPEEKLFNKMSPSLRFDLARLVAGETLFAIPLITVMEDSFKGFVSYALFLMKPLCILRSEKVCRSGGPGTEMFFLVDGECDLLNSETNQGHIVGENAVFEQYSLMAHANEIYRTVSTVTAVSKKCVLYSLTIQDFRILEDVSPAVSTYFLSQLAAVLIDDDLFALTPQQQVNVERALRNGRAFRAVAEQHEKARLSTVSNVALAKLTAPRRRGSEWAPDLLPRALKRMDTGNVGAEGDAIPGSIPSVDPLT